MSVARLQIHQVMDADGVPIKRCSRSYREAGLTRKYVELRVFPIR
jgi:hypothetical protein